MSCIVPVRVGKHTYLYESVSYRDENGNPRNKRKSVGKIEPKTGRHVYKPEYLERMAAEGTPVNDASMGEPPVITSFSVNDVQLSSIRDFGAFYLYRKLAEQIGLLNVLQSTFPDYWEEIFNLAAYLVSTGDPFNYCEDWLANTEAFPVGSMSSQRISELLASITNDERNDFYHYWCAVRSKSEYLALDITSTSSYSELIESVEWGYNRDGEKLPQINICLLMGYQSRYPIYQSVYAGSLKDVTTLKTTIQTFRPIAGEKQIVAVMDKGFYKMKNINAMLSDEQHVDFIIAIPFTTKFAKELVISESKEMDTLKNTIVSDNETLRAVTKVCNWNRDYKVYAHVYYNARKAQGIREDLYTKVAMLRDEAINNPTKCVGKLEYENYLIINRSENQDAGYTVTLREDVVAAELETSGWVIIISNCISDTKEAIKVYREKDIVEKGFLRLKNSLDLGRLRVHSEDSMQNKVFIGFIALILLSCIHNTMSDKNLYKKMTMKKLILTLSKLRLQIVKGVRVLFPVTKEQRDIYEAFNVVEPV